MRPSPMPPTSTPRRPPSGSDADGQRYTPRRRALVDAAGRGRPAAHHPRSCSSGGGTWPRARVYRNLAVLERAGVVHRIVTTDEFARYELAEDLTEHHHHHLICSACGDVDRLHRARRRSSATSRPRWPRWPSAPGSGSATTASTSSAPAPAARADRTGHRPVPARSPRTLLAVALGLAAGGARSDGWWQRPPNGRAPAPGWRCGWPERWPRSSPPPCCPSRSGGRAAGAGRGWPPRSSRCRQGRCPWWPSC